MHRSLSFLLLPLALAGCGGGLKKFSTTKVTGKVLCEGKPVQHVRINFAPMGDQSGQALVGKMGMGIAQADGTFSVSTYGNEDGAVVGKHQVSVSSPHPEDFPDFTCNCETVGNRKPVMEVEVQADGKNDFTIELPVKTRSSRPNIDPEDLADAKAK